MASDQSPQMLANATRNRAALARGQFN